MEKPKNTEDEVGSRIKETLFEKFNISDTDALRVLDILSEGSSVEEKVSKLELLKMDNLDKVAVTLCVLSLYVSISNQCSVSITDKKSIAEIKALTKLNDTEQQSLIRNFAVAFQDCSNDPASALKTLFIIAPLLISTGLFPAHVFADVLLIILEGNGFSLNDLIKNCELVTAILRSSTAPHQVKGTIH